MAQPGFHPWLKVVQIPGLACLLEGWRAGHTPGRASPQVGPPRDEHPDGRDVLLDEEPDMLPEADAHMAVSPGPGQAQDSLMLEAQVRLLRTPGV